MGLLIIDGGQLIFFLMSRTNAAHGCKRAVSDPFLNGSIKETRRSIYECLAGFLVFLSYFLRARH